jgi:LacI family transcriptional regulator
LQTAREQVPVVTLYHTPLDPELPNVGLDQQHVGELAARHLIEQGCRRILYIYNIDRRHDGHRKVLAEAGIEYLPELIWRGDIDQFDAAAGESAVRSMIERGIRFDGVQAQSDAEAVGAINQLFRMGYSVPQQVKVIGVDDSPHCELSRVPLTSICQHYRERAETAVAMLHRAIEGDSVTSVQHTPTLRMRDSTATAV